MKAILVVDAEPMNCDDCPFQTKNQFCMAWVYKIDSNSVDYTDDIANGCRCPLKPMPEKYIEHGITIESERDAAVCSHGITLGHNDAIEELEK